MAIVEHKDASAEERAIGECNTGIMAMTATHLRRWLPQLSADNAQGEYYLTDVIAMAAAEGTAIATTQPGSPGEVEGINAGVYRLLVKERNLTGIDIVTPNNLSGTLRNSCIFIPRDPPGYHCPCVGDVPAHPTTNKHRIPRMIQ